MQFIADNHDEPSNEELGIKLNPWYVAIAFFAVIVFWSGLTVWVMS